MRRGTENAAIRQRPVGLKCHHEFAKIRHLIRASQSVQWTFATITTHTRYLLDKACRVEETMRVRVLDASYQF